MREAEACTEIIVCYNVFEEHLQPIHTLLECNGIGVYNFN